MDRSMQSTHANDNACSRGCQACKLEGPAEGGLAGWRLVTAAAVGLLLPLVLAAVGAAVCSRSTAWAGGLAGLLIGVAAAVAVGRLQSGGGEQAKEAS